MLILKMVRNVKYAILSILLALTAHVLYPFLQVLPQGLNNFWFWFSLLTPLSWALYVLYGGLFGLTLSFFIFRWSEKSCPIPRKMGSGTAGGVGAFIGMVLPQCAACLSAAAFFLPFSAYTFVARHSVEVMFLSVGLLVFSLWVMGAFNKIES